jgi:hypothetical protein
MRTFRPAPPKALRPLVELVQMYVQSCPVIGHYPPQRGASRPDLTGQCTNAAALFWYLAGGKALGWQNMRLPSTLDHLGRPKRDKHGRLLQKKSLWSEGPHAFVVHLPTGVVVDPTEGQYPPRVRIPYERAEGGTSGGFRKDTAGRTVPPRKVRTAARALRLDPRAASAIKLARDWARTNRDG